MSIDNNKYPGYNENDNFWNEHHRKNGMMTNREFFSSNAEGGFYEGMEWDGKSWSPNTENRKREAEIKANECDDCGGQRLQLCEVATSKTKINKHKTHLKL